MGNPTLDRSYLITYENVTLLQVQPFWQRNQGELQYGLLSHNGPSNKKVVVLTVDPHKCDVRISQQLNLNCTKTVEQSDIKTYVTIKL